MKRWWFDGIVWMAVGISLVAQAGFLVSMSWFATDAPPTEAIPATVASAVVGACFLVVGFAALGLGVRRIRSSSRDRSAVVEQASVEHG